MASRCDRCGKGLLRGKKIARARQGLNYRSPKIFRPNLHSFKLVVNGRRKKLALCTKCLRRVKKEQEELKKKEAALRAKIEAKKKQLRKKKIDKPKKTEKKPKTSRKEARRIRKKKKEAKEKRKTAVKSA